MVIASILAYRYGIISNYVAQITDEDQAIMWCGTMAALDNNIQEPHFLGQKYGSMIESYVAIPFYLLGLPLESALPTVTVILWIFPFVACALILAKNEQWLEAAIILGLSVIYGWEYDILTNISRSFISGFWLTFIGLLLLLKEHKGPKEIFGIIVSFTLGFWISEQTITLVALAIFHIAYSEGFFTSPRGFFRKFQTWEREKKFALFAGLLFSVLFLGYCNYLFYYLNPDYNLHKIGSFKLKSRIFKGNLRNIGELFEAYSLITVMGIPVCAIIVIGTFLLFWRKCAIKECLLMFGLSVVGILIILGCKKTLEYGDPLLIGKQRLFLFVPYVILFLAYYSFKLKNITKFVTRKYGSKCISGILGILVFCLVVISGMKLYNFKNYYLQDERLYTSTILRVQRVNVIKIVADELKQLVKENNVKNVIFLENCAFAYGTAAYNYGEYRTYLTHYERKTQDYLFFKNNLFTGKILFVNCNDKGILSYRIENFEKSNILNYISQRYLNERHRKLTDELYQRDCF